MLAIITEGKHPGSVPYCLNGQFGSVAVGVPVEISEDLFAALEDAGENIAVYHQRTGAATGRITVTDTHTTRRAIMVNGALTYITTNEPFTPSAAVLEAIDNAGMAYTVEYDTVALGDLSLDNLSIYHDFPAGAAVGSVTGQTEGSTLELTGNAGGKFALVDGVVKVFAALAAAEYEIEITETLDGYTDSPQTNTITIAVEERFALSDFKNGVYRLDGATVAVGDVWVENLTYGAFDPLTSIVADVGFNSETDWPISSAALLALLDPVGEGFTAVMDYRTITLAGSDQADAFLLFGDIGYTAEWHVISRFRATAHASDSAVILGDFDTDATNSNAALNNTGLKRIAINVSTTGMFVSVNGSPVYERLDADLSDPDSSWHIILQYNAEGSGAGAIESIAFYPLVLDAALPGLSAIS